MPRLIEWDALDLVARGSRIAEVAGQVIRENRLPIEELTLQFRTGLLRVEGRARKGIAVPFGFSIRRIEVAGTKVIVPLEEMSTFRFLPFPAFLLKIFERFLPADAGVDYDSVNNAFIVAIDRFLPPFVDVELSKIALIEGGLAIRVGRGGADPPM